MYHPCHDKPSVAIPLAMKYYEQVMMSNTSQLCSMNVHKFKCSNLQIMPQIIPLLI